MKFTMRFYSLVFMLAYFGCKTFATDSYSLNPDSLASVIGKYIVTGQNDSAKIALKTLKPTYKQYNHIKRITTQPVLSYEDITSVYNNLLNNQVLSLFDINKGCEKLIQNNKPFKHPINEGYIKIQGLRIDYLTLLNLMPEATIVHESLEHYLSLYSKEDSLYQYGKFHLNTLPNVLALIETDYTKMEAIYKDNRAIAYFLNNPSLKIRANNHYIPALVSQNLPKESIKLCKENLELDKTLPNHSDSYWETVRQLIIASLYQYKIKADTINHTQIKEWMSILHNFKDSPPIRIENYSSYLKYLILLDINSKHFKEVLAFFNVDNLIELCRFFEAESEKGLTTLSLNYFLKDAASTLEHFGYLKEALAYRKKSGRLFKKIYTKDLTEQLSKNRTKLLEKEHQYELDILNEKNKITYYLSVALLIIVLLLAWIVYIQINSNKKLKQSDSEKLLLLKEIHHRIKNNFQLASGFLHLQFKGIKDQTIQQYINQWDTRVKSIIAVHQSLYQNDTLYIYLNAHTKTILNTIAQIYPDIKTNINIDIPDNYILDNDTAVNVGLILNELMTNAIKYGSKNNVLDIHITCSQYPTHYELNFKDNGNNFNPHSAETKSFGFRLINRLSKQMDGSFAYHNGFTVCFKDTSQKK